jgi:hypothetical protein
MPIDDAARALKQQFELEDLSKSPVSERLASVASALPLPYLFDKLAESIKDRNSIFQKAGPQSLPEQLRGDRPRTQFGRALNELGIEWIAAHSPQAKGRIERLFNAHRRNIAR